MVLSWALRLKRGERPTVKDKTRLKTGIIGGAGSAICCVTPILVVAVSALGLAAVVPWLDFLLFPALAMFVGMVAYALVLAARRRAS